MTCDLATAYRIIPARPGDVQGRWAVPMPPPGALPRLPWRLLYLRRTGYYGRGVVMVDALLLREPVYPPRTLQRALQVLVEAGSLVPLDRRLQEVRG